VDLPGGGGKIELHKRSVVAVEDSAYVVRDLEGREY